MSTQSDHRSLTEFSDLAEFTAARGHGTGSDRLAADRSGEDRPVGTGDDDRSRGIGQARRGDRIRREVRGLT
jgi:hypothetical protein